MTAPGAVRDLADLTAADLGSVGGKAANLGELIGAGFPVPAGFALPAAEHLAALARAGVREDVARLHDEARVAASHDPAALDGLCRQLTALARSAPVPSSLEAAVRAAYARLPDPEERGAVVAVRTSAVGEDGTDDSFAGMNATFTNVQGADALLAHVEDCWASAYAPRVVAYRAERGITGEPAVAVVVESMVPAERAGVAFTADPTTGRTDVVVVEAAFGQGEVVVSGAVEPDTYQFAADGVRLTSLRVGHQTHEVVRGRDGADLTVPLDPERASGRVLSDDEAAEVARLALRVQEHFGAPQDVEWAMTGRRQWLLQSRPITTLGTVTTTPLVRGLAASPGRACGRVRVLAGP